MNRLCSTLLALAVMITPSFAYAEEPNCKSYKEDPSFYGNFQQVAGNGFLELEFMSQGSRYSFRHNPYFFTVKELGSDRKTAFVFQLQSVNGEISNGHEIELYDPFRGLWLLLDYCDMYVKIIYQQSGTYQNLYPLT